MSLSSGSNVPSPSRRTLTKGLAWSVPAVVVGAAVPAYAASTVSTRTWTGSPSMTQAQGNTRGSLCGSGTGCKTVGWVGTGAMTGSGLGGGFPPYNLNTVACSNGVTIGGLNQNDTVVSVDWYFTSAPNITWVQSECLSAAGTTITATWSAPVASSDLDGSTFAGATVTSGTWTFGGVVSTVYKSTILLNTLASNLLHCSGNVANNNNVYQVPVSCGWYATQGQTPPISCLVGGKTAYFYSDTSPSTFPAWNKMDVLRAKVNSTTGAFTKIGGNASTGNIQGESAQTC